MRIFCNNSTLCQFTIAFSQSPNCEASCPGDVGGELLARALGSKKSLVSMPRQDSRSLLLKGFFSLLIAFLLCFWWGFLVFSFFVGIFLWGFLFSFCGGPMELQLCSPSVLANNVGVSGAEHSLHLG